MGEAPRAIRHANSKRKKELGRSINALEARIPSAMRIVISDYKRPARSVLGLGQPAWAFCGWPGRTVGYCPVFRAYLTRPGRTADVATRNRFN